MHKIINILRFSNELDSLKHFLDTIIPKPSYSAVISNNKTHHNV